MKLQVFRSSGLPVAVADLQAQKQEWTTAYDKLEAECAGNMERLQKETQELADALQKKYSILSTMEIPKNRKQWANLIDSFQAPVMISRSAENPDELVMVIVDQPF